MPYSADRIAETSDESNRLDRERQHRDPVVVVAEDRPGVDARDDVQPASETLGQLGLVRLDRLAVRGDRRTRRGDRDGADDVGAAALVASRPGGPGRAVGGDLRRATAAQACGPASSQSRRPASTPAPKGAYSLWPEKMT